MSDLERRAGSEGSYPTAIPPSSSPSCPPEKAGKDGRSEVQRWRSFLRRPAPLLNGPDAILRRQAFGHLWVGLSPDDFADAYHGVPNDPDQLDPFFIAARCPKSNKMVFFISYTHMFGLSVAHR